MRVSWPEFLYPLYDLAVRLGKSVFRRGHPLTRNEGLNPFFIVGSGRCGTTLLRRILQASPEVHIPPEMSMLHSVIPLFRRNRSESWGWLVRLVLAAFDYDPFFWHFRIESLRPLVDKLTGLPEDRRSLAIIIDQVVRYHGEQTGQTFERWGDKTPGHFYRMRELLAIFPDARFIHMVRDGVDVAASYARSSLPHDLDSAAKRWVASLRAVRHFAKRHASQCLEVRYENLVADPEGAVADVCRFLNVGFDATMIERLDHIGEMGELAEKHLENVRRPISVASIGRGRRELTQEQKEHLQRLIGKELAMAGYEPAA